MSLKPCVACNKDYDAKLLHDGVCGKCLAGSCQTNRLKHHKRWERGFYEATRERHSVRAASRFSLKVLRVESDLCELK